MEVMEDVPLRHGRVGGERSGVRSSSAELETKQRTMDDSTHPECGMEGMEISHAGKPLTLSGMQTKAQSIDLRYWECKAELHRQTSASTSPPSSEIPITSNLPASTSNPYDPTSKSDTSDTHSLPPSDSDSDPSDDSSSEDSDPSPPLESDGKSSDT